MYDYHVELITLLKAAGDFDKLRAAREAMNLIFPLTEGTTIAKRKPKCQYGIDGTWRALFLVRTAGKLV